MRGLTRWDRLCVLAVVLGVAGLTQSCEPPPENPATFTAVADTHVTELEPDTPHGSSTKLYADASPVRRSYLRFEVGNLGGPVVLARLEVYADVASSGFQAAKVSSTTWDEDAVTYDDAPAVGALVQSSGPSSAGWVALNVTRAVSGSGPVSLALTTPGTSLVTFRSRESGSTAPRLIVHTGSDPSTTTTSTPPPTDPVVAAAGDIACSPSSADYHGGFGTASTCRMLATSDLLLDGGYDAVLSLGDEQYGTASLTAYRQSYDPSWGRVKQIIHPSPGDHEYASPGASGYFAYHGAAAGEAGKGWYSYDMGTWHVVVLNSNCTAVACAAGSVQEQWLRADLAAHPAVCTLAYWHDPRFSSGEHGNDPAVGPFWEALHAAGADVVLAGDDHHYERFGPQDPSGAADPLGIRQFVVGTGGKSLEGFPTVQPNSVVRSASAFGVLELTLGTASYDWRFVAESGQSFTDGGSGTCH